MAKFIVYEVWTRAKQIEADTITQAYAKSDPEPVSGMSLCNWHAIKVDDDVREPSEPS